MNFPTQPGRVLADFTALGLDIPELERLAATAKAMAEALEVDPAESIASAIMAGDIGPDDAANRITEAARAQTARDAVQPIWAAASKALSRRTKELVRSAAPTILAELAPRFEEAASRLAATVGIRVPTKHKEILRHPHLATTHATRDEASRELDAIARTRTSLATSYRWADREPSMSWFIAGAENLDRLEQAERIGRNWLELLEAGFQLRLNDPDQARRVVADATAATAQAKRAREEKASEKARRIGRVELAVHEKALEEAKR